MLVDDESDLWRLSGGCWLEEAILSYLLLKLLKLLMSEVGGDGWELWMTE